jgi:hypothetical protein
MFFGRHFDLVGKIKRYFDIGSDVIETRGHEIPLQHNHVRQKPTINQMLDLLFSHFYSLLVLVLISSFLCQKSLQEKPDLLSRFMGATEKNLENMTIIFMNFIIAGLYGSN